MERKTHSYFQTGSTAESRILEFKGSNTPTGIPEEDKGAPPPPDTGDNAETHKQKIKDINDKLTDPARLKRVRDLAQKELDEEKQQEAEKASTKAEKAIQDNVRLALPASGEADLQSIQKQLELSANHFSVLTPAGKQRLVTEMNKLLQPFKVHFEFKDGKPKVIEIESPPKPPRPLGTPDTTPETPDAKMKKAYAALLNNFRNNIKESMHSSIQDFNDALAQLEPDPNKRAENKYLKELGEELKKLGRTFTMKDGRIDIPFDAPAGAPSAAPRIGFGPGETPPKNFFELLGVIFRWLKDFMEKDWKKLQEDRNLQLKRQADALEKRNQLDDELKKLNATIKDQEALIKKMKEENVPKKQLDEAIQRFEQMKQKRDNVMKELEKAQKNLAEMERKSKEHAGKVRELNEKIARAIAENDALRGMQFSIEPQTDGTMKIRITWANKEKLAEIQKKLSEKGIDSAVTSKAGEDFIEFTVATLEQLRKVEDQLYYTEQSLGREELAHGKTKEEKKKAEQHAEHLRASLTKVTADLAQAKTDLTKVEKARDEAAQKAAAVEKQLAVAKDVTKMDKNEIARLNQELVKQKAIVEEKNAEITAKAAAIKALEGQKRTTEAELKKEQAEHGVTKGKLEEVSKKLEAKSKEYDMLKSEKESADKKIKEKEAELRTLEEAKKKGDTEAQGKIDALNKDLTTARTERDAKVTELGDAKKALEAEGKKLADALEHNKQLRDFLTGLKTPVNPDHLKFIYDADKKLVMIDVKDRSNPEHMKALRNASVHIDLQIWRQICGPCGVQFVPE